MNNLVLIDFSSVQTRAVHCGWPLLTAVAYHRMPLTTFDACERGDDLIALLDFISVLPAFKIKLEKKTKNKMDWYLDWRPLGLKADLVSCWEGRPASYLGPNCLLDTSALVSKFPDSSDPPNQCRSVLGPNCLGYVWFLSALPETGTG